MNKTNSDSSERKYVHLSNKSFEICLCLHYGYTQVPVDLFCETLVHCLVTVCIHVLPFLYLKKCGVILEFESTVSCNLSRETCLQSTEPYMVTGLYEMCQP